MTTTFDKFLAAGLVLAIAAGCYLLYTRPDPAPGGDPLKPEPIVKKTLVYCSMKNCPACDKMKAETLNGLQLNAKFWDYVEVGKAEASVKYGVRAFPTCLVLDDDGKVLRRRVGFVPQGEFLTWLEGL